MITKKPAGKKSRKRSKGTGRSRGSSARTGNHSMGEKQRLSSPKGGKGSTNSKNTNKSLKILPEHEPFIWLMLARGCSLQATADAYTEQFGVKVSKSGIQKHRDTNKATYDEFRESWYADVKQEPIANSRTRIVEYWNMAVALRKRVLEILGMPPIFWKDLNVASLIAQFVNLIDKIREEAGDKARVAETPTQPIQNYFGDVTINAFADQAINARTKETPDTRNRLKAPGFLDSGDSLSDN